MKEEIWNELYLYLIRIENGVSKISRNVLARPVMGTIFLVSTDTCMYPSCYMKHVMSACYLLVGSPCMHARCYNIILGK